MQQLIILNYNPFAEIKVKILYSEPSKYTN